MEREDPLASLCRERVGRFVSGKWRLDALIGVGGMAAVYMATHKNGSLAAVKILHRGLPLGKEARDRFLREAYVANRIDHPGTVRVLADDTDDDGTPYIVTELLRGISVEALAERSGGQLSVGETLDILDQTLSVLELAHAQAIVHCDLKPANLFVTDKGQVKVLDFGIARLRQEIARRTRTGMITTTTAFLAPEQAMGRWNDVDPRTDVWALGATGFTLLAGQPVHAAATSAEMVLAAATHPARSLGRVLNDAPTALVALLDRALAFERDQRFPDATSFRAELQRIRPALLEARPLQPPIASARPATSGRPGTAVQAMSLSPAGEVDSRRQRVETYDPNLSSNEDIERMTSCFSSLQRALVATLQYGPEHPEAKRRFDETYREFAAALSTCDATLAWNLTPYSFGVRERMVWEPEPPWNRIPYQLFSDGVRTMGLLPGLDETEFRKWLRLMLLDPATDIAPEDDLVTMLWEAQFVHLVFQAVDSFEEGTQDQRARFQAQRTRVLAGAHQDHRIALELLCAGGAPNRGEAPKQSALDKTRELLRALARAQGADAEALARIAKLNVLEESPDEGEAARMLQLDDNALMLLAARIELDVEATGERFVVAAATAFVACVRAGRVAPVAGALRHAVDNLAASSPSKAIDMMVALHEAVIAPNDDPETARLRDVLMAEMLSAPALAQVLAGSKQRDAETQAEYLRGIAKLLGWLQPIHFDVALEFLPDSPDGPIRELLLELLPRFAPGHEPVIGALFPKLPISLALRMVRCLVAIDTPEAKDAITLASTSPHALVRIEALGHVEGATGTRLRAEMHSLLDDPDASVRLLALRAMEEHHIAIAGPFLVLRIQDRQFCRLPIEERRQALQALSGLRAKRCEEVCMELLGDEHLLRSSASEETRELAAHFLAEVASSTPAYFLLQSIADSSLLRNSKRVRDAAAAGLARLRQRAAEAEQRKSERLSQRAGRTSMRVRKGEGSSLMPGKSPGASGRPLPAAPAGGPRASRAPGVVIRPSLPSTKPGSATSSRSPSPIRPPAPSASPVAAKSSRAPGRAGSKAPTMSARAPRGAADANHGSDVVAPKSRASMADPPAESGPVSGPGQATETTATRELGGKPAARQKARGKP